MAKKIPRNLDEALKTRPIGMKVGEGYYLRRYDHEMSYGHLITANTRDLLLSLDQKTLSKIAKLFPNVDYRIEQLPIVFIEGTGFCYLMTDPLDREGPPRRLFSGEELEEMINKTSTVIVFKEESPLPTKH